jgi:hypothetical protein
MDKEAVKQAMQQLGVALALLDDQLRRNLTDEQLESLLPEAHPVSRMVLVVKAAKALGPEIVRMTVEQRSQIAYLILLPMRLLTGGPKYE